MGNNPSALVDVASNYEVDERLVACNEELFEEGFLKKYARDFKRLRFRKFDTRPESTGPVFGFRPLTKKVQHELMEDIANLSNDRKANMYTIEVEKRIHAIRKIHTAIRREIIRDRNRTQASANALKSRIENDAPPLPASAKIGIKTSVKMFLILIKSAQHSDDSVLEDILGLLCEIVDDTPPLALIDGPNFSPDVSSGLRPLLDYIRMLVIDSNQPSQRRSNATKVLFGVAIARGSLLEFLSLCHVLLSSDRVGECRNILSTLRCLVNYRSDVRSDTSKVITDSSLRKNHPHATCNFLPSERRHSLSSVGSSIFASKRRSSAGIVPMQHDEEKTATSDDDKSFLSTSLFPHSPDDIMRRYVPNLEKFCDDEPIDARVAALIVISQLDRLSQSYARQPDEDIWNDDPNRLAVLYKPLCVDVKPETLSILSEIIDVLSPGYFTSDACPDSKYIPNMYFLVACLRILKVHLYQLVRAKLPQSEFLIASYIVDRIRMQIFKFLETPSASRSSEIVSDTAVCVSNVVQSEAAQILAEAFEFFYSSVSDQVAYLGELIRKFNASEKTGEPNHCGTRQSLSTPEQDLLELLLSRFSSFSSGSLLLDELEQTFVQNGSVESSRTVMDVLRSLISANVHEVSDALRSIGKSLPDSNVLLILQNFQKHLLSRGGLYLDNFDTTVSPVAVEDAGNSSQHQPRHMNDNNDDTVNQYEEDPSNSNTQTSQRHQSQGSNADGSAATPFTTGPAVSLDANPSSNIAMPIENSEVRNLPSSSSEQTATASQNLQSMVSDPAAPISTFSDLAVEDPEKARTRRAIMGVVWDYSKDLISASLEIIRLANSIISSDQTSEGLRRVGEDILRESLICKLTRPLIGVLCIFAGQLDGPQMALQLFPIMSEFLCECDRLCSLVKEISQPEDEMSVDKRRVVQSRHPYRNNVDREEIVSIKDAQSLIITFDISKCSTQSEEDYVQLFKLSNKRDPLTERLYGPADGSNWPAEPISVSGDSLVVHFHSGSGGNGWGYRINVLGTVLVTPLQWLVDFTQNISWLCGRMGASLLFGPEISKQERELQGANASLFKCGIEPTHPLFPCVDSSILECNFDIVNALFLPNSIAKPCDKHGLEASAVDHSSFLQSIIDISGLGKVLIEKLTHLCPDRHIVQRSILEHSNTATAGVFAVLLKHTRRIESAMSIASGAEDIKPPESILRLWKKAQEMKLELRSLKAQGEDIEEYLNIILARVDFLLHICADKGFIAVEDSNIIDAITAADLSQSDLDGMVDKNVAAAAFGLPMSGGEGHFNGRVNPLIVEADDVDRNVIFESSSGSGFSSISASRSNSLPELTGPMIIMQKSSKWTQAMVMTKLLKNTMKALRRLKELMLVRTRLASVKQDPESVLIRSVFKFMTARVVDLDGITEGLVAQRTRATMRLIGLKQFSNLVKEIKTQSLLPELLLHLNSAFRRTSEAGSKFTKISKHHFTADVPTVGQDLSNQLSETYFDIASSLIAKQNLDDASLLHLLDICNIDFTPQDLTILHRIGIVRFLSPLISFTGSNRALLEDTAACSDLRITSSVRRCPWNIRFGAWTLFRMLAYSASSQISTSFEGPNLVFNAAYNQMSLLWSMRQHQERSSKTRDILANEMDICVEISHPTASLANWSCRRCTYFNDSNSFQCSVCCLTFSDNEELVKDDVEPEETEQKGIEFVYEADFDTKGILYYLGTAGGVEPWRNPHDLGSVRVTASSQQGDSNPISAVAGRTAVRCVTQPSPNQWFAIDLLEHSVIPTHYTLRHYSSWDTEALRFWNFEGSNDGVSWSILRSHNNDRSLDKRGASHTWEIANASESYSHFRIFMTGQNSNDHWYLALSGFELYGVLDGDAELISSRKSNPEKQTGSLFDYWDIRDSKEIEFSGDNPNRPVSVTHTNTTESWHSVKGIQAYSFGRHLIEFRIDRDGNGSNSWKFIIGVVPHRFSINNTSTWIGSQGGWGYIGGLGHKNFNSSTNRQYGATFTAGDTVGVRLDFDAGTIEFLKNGASQGVAFDNLSGPVFAAVSMTGYQSKVTLVQPSPSDEDSRLPDVDRISWHTRIREANLGDASVFWYKNTFEDEGIRGRPAFRHEPPTVGEFDAYLNQYLWLILRCCPFPAVQKILTSRAWIRFILDAAAYASPLGKLLAVRICRYILPGISPNDDRLFVTSESCPDNGDSASRIPGGQAIVQKKTDLITEFLERAADASFQLPPRLSVAQSLSDGRRSEDQETKGRKDAIEASLTQYKQRCGARSGPTSLSFIVKRGTIEISGWHHLRATTGFATAVADVSVSSGKWYFEAILESGGLQQIGIARAEFNPVGAGDGVGDDKVSWAFDGLRGKKWHDGSAAYGGQAPWKTGDVVGVCLNLDAGEIRYFLSGVDLGVAFTDVKQIDGSGLFPAISMSAGESIRFVFDSAKFCYKCPEGYFPLIGDKPTLQQLRFVPWSIECDAIGSEYVSLSRVLMRSTLWKVLFNEVLWNGLQALSTLPSDLDSVCLSLRAQHSKDLDWGSPAVPEGLCTSIRRIVSALSVLGGNIESVRQGARVSVESTDGQLLEGTVTRIIREQNKGIIVVVNLENGEDVTVSELAQLSARANVELSSSHVKNPGELIRVLGKFLSSQISKNILRFPTARKILMQIHRQALKVLLGLFDNPDFVSIFLDAGLGQLIGKRALSTSEPLADGLVNMVSNLEARCIALERRRRELHDPECADDKWAQLRFSGDVHYSRALGFVETNYNCRNAVSFDDMSYVEKISVSAETRISEVCVWADENAVFGFRASYISGESDHASAPKHIGTIIEIGAANLVSLKSDEFFVSLEIVSAKLENGSSTSSPSDSANVTVIATLILTTNHEAVHIFGRPIVKNHDESKVINCLPLHGIIAFFGTSTTHLQSIGFVEQAVRRVKVRKFVFQSDMDENGIVYFLGTKNGTSAFQNPMALGLVEVSVARIKADSHPVSAIVGREAVRCLCNDTNYGWFSIDFKRYLIRPNKYTLRHYASWDTEALRSWRLQGSTDGTDWTLLREHVDDASLNKKGQAFSWDLPGITQFFRHFRILMTGKNSNNHNYLSLSGFEIYGELLEEIPELRAIPSSSDFLDQTSDDLGLSLENINAQSSISGELLPARSNNAASNNPSALGVHLYNGAISAVSPSANDLLATTVAPTSAQTAIEPGQIYSFGHGGSGRLGHGNNSAVQLPKLVDGFDGRQVSSISCFNQHVLALTECGQVFSWGNNGEGRLGHGDTVAVARPKLISALEDINCVQVCAGNSFSAVLDAEHRVWVFGKGNEGQMGNGSVSDQKSPIQVKGVLEVAEISRIGVGAFHCLALTSSGDLYTWGRNLRGQLGLNSTAKKKLMPEKVQNNCPVFVEVRGGWDHSMALTAGGQLYSWGNGYEGSRPATGHGTNQNILSPKLVSALKDKVVVRISAGWDHSIALTKDGEAYLWGGNPSGVLGTGTTNQESVPKLLCDEMSKERIVWVDGGQSHTCAVTEKGELWMWGSLLGTESKVPRKVETLAQDLCFQYVVCGDKANYAVSCEIPRRVPSTPVVAIGATDIMYPPYPQSAFLLGPPSNFFVGFAAAKAPVINAVRAPRLDLALVSSDGGQHSEEYKAGNVLADNDEAYCTTKKRNVNIVAESDPKGHFMYVTAVSARNPDPETFTAPLLSALVFVLDDINEVIGTERFNNFTHGQYVAYIAKKQAEDSEPVATEPVGFIDLSNSIDCYAKCDLLRAGKYVLFKLIEARTKETNIDVEFFAAYGYLDELPIDLEHKRNVDKHKTAQDARLEADARKKQHVRNFASDAVALYKGPITIDQDLKDGGLIPGPMGALHASFTSDSKTGAAGVTACLRFRPSPPLANSPKSSILLSLASPESGASVQLLSDPSFRMLTLRISDGGPAVVSEDIVLEDIGNELHHACLVLDQRCMPIAERKSVTVSAFIDGALACSLVAPSRGVRLDVSCLMFSKGNVIFGCGINGQFREAGIWGFALDAKQVHDLCQSTLEFCTLDNEETQLHAMQVRTYEVSLNEVTSGMTPIGKFSIQTVESTNTTTSSSKADPFICGKNTPTDALFIALTPDSWLNIERPLGRKPLMDSYSVIMDISFPVMPTNEDSIIIRCMSGGVAIRPDGRFVIIGRSENKKSIRKIFAGIWYRIVISVDLQKSQVFVFVNGMMATSLTGEDKLLSRSGPLSLPVPFDLCHGKSVPIHVRRVQIRSKPMTQSNAIRLRSAEDPLEDGRDINVVARSLLKMGYPMRWCSKALLANGMDRRLASDFILQNAQILQSQDRLEEHNKAAQILSLMGFPRKMCVLALSKSSNNSAAAILYLLDNISSLSDFELIDDDTGIDATGKSQSVDDAPRNLNIEKSEGNNAAFHILKNTKESMEASLDDLVLRSAPKRTVEYPELQNLNKNELYAAMAANEDALSITYSRKCVLSILQNWPPSKPLSLRIFGDDNFLVNFMRLVEFSQLSDGLDVLRSALLRILEREESAISEVLAAEFQVGRVPSSASFSQSSSFSSIGMLRQFAPVARQLLAEALNHMVGLINDPHSKVLNEADALSHPNPGLVIWILNLFAECIPDPLSLSYQEAASSATVSSAVSVMFGNKSDNPAMVVQSPKSLSNLGRIIFSGPIVNLVFEVIAVSSGEQRLSFVRLLSHLIKFGVQFDSSRSLLLKDLMNHMHVAQSSKGVYSAFFQALIELNVSVEKIEIERSKLDNANDLEKREDNPSIAANSPEISETSVAVAKDNVFSASNEETSSQGIQFTYSEDMDTNGILYYLGTNQNTTAWTNPCELGVVKVTASSVMLDSKPASAIVGREAVRCVTKPLPNQWFIIDFLDHSVIPTYYTLRHYSSWDTEALRSWKLEASNDGVTWVILKEHRNDASLCKKGQSHSWSLPASDESYSQFRINMTDQNSNQHWYLSLSGFEIYGTLDGDALSWEEEEKEFIYSEDMDNNGILYYLGTNELTDSWQNPADMGLVRVEACSLQHNSSPKSAIVGREAVRCVSQPNQDQWFVIDFLDRRIVPTKYTLRHYNSYDTEALRNWRLEGSTDGNNWVTLREHRDDSSLKLKGQTFTWDIVVNQPAESFSKFRIFMFGKNSNDHWYLSLSGFEIYGRMLVRTGQRTKHSLSGRNKPRNKPWFESVLLVDAVIHSVTSKQPLPRPFSKKVWKQICSWTSGKNRSNGDDDVLIEFDQIMSSFDGNADEDLVRMINRFVEKSTSDPMHMKANEFEVKQEDLLPYRSLEEIPLRYLQIRFFTLQQLNIQLSSIMGLVDFSLPAQMSSLADGIRTIRSLIFFRTKEVLWNRALEETKCQSSDRELELDRFRAAKLKESRKSDVKGTRSLFGQAFQQLNNRDPKMFRLEKSKCAWKTVFKGEFSDDYGGPYRNSIEDFCNELHTDIVPLFIKCPNGRENIGTNREKFVPRPSSVSPLHLAMYEFVGKLMGLAIRTKNVLDLDLPSIVWKPLVSDPITEEDVLSIDLLSFKILDELKKFEVSGDLPNEYFTACVNSKFVVIGSDQRVYPLVPGGHHIQVTWDNRHQFAKALIHYRLNEFKVQCEAIRRGLATVVPYPLLSLFTWHELEVEVCGRPKMNVDLLEHMTVYESCSAQDQHVIIFWRMMRERLDDIERCQFLRFVWGRSRLPLKQEDFDRKFKISRMHQADRSPDDYLPISHTCFFSLELPRYSSLEIMHKKILYAITHCVAIDADDTSVAQDAARRSADVDADSDNDSDIE